MTYANKGGRPISVIQQLQFLYLYHRMKNSVQFFIQYYLKKHIGFLWGAAIDAPDVFWKNFFRLKASIPVTMLEESSEQLLLQSTQEGKQFQCYIRNAPSSDIFVFRQVYENKEYMPLIKLLQNDKVYNKPVLIVDAGANVGYTAVLLKLYFPEAILLAIEPDVANAKQISLNFAANKIDNTEVIVAGVWSHDCWLELKKDKSKGEEWGFYVAESSSPTGLRGIDILNLPQLNNGGIIDILKIDIEGSEAKLFADREKVSLLLSITKHLAIEIHDDIADRRHIQQMLSDNNFTWFESGELTIATNKNLVHC